MVKLSQLKIRKYKIMKKTLTIFIAIALVVIAGVGVAWILMIKATAPPGNMPNGVTGSPIACTMEAKLCPDGSAVGRSGPNCEFAPCPELK